MKYSVCLLSNRMGKKKLYGLNQLIYKFYDTEWYWSYIIKQVCRMCYHMEDIVQNGKVINKKNYNMCYML